MNKKTLWFLGIFGVFIVFWIQTWKAMPKDTESTAASARIAAEETVMQKTITINTEWSGPGEELRGVACSEPGMIIEITMLTHGVDWEVRADGNEARTYPARSAGENYCINLPTFAEMLEARVKPGQYIDGIEITEAKILVKIIKKRS